MSSNVGSISTPLVRGALGALGSLGMALAVVVVPALAAQVAGTASTATSLDAIIIALNILVLGHGGGIMLSTGVIDGAVTLTPFGLLLILLLLSGAAMRRVGRALRPVRDDGVLRVGALRDVGAALAMYASVYAVGLAVLAGVGRSVDTAPMLTSAAVSGAMVAVIGGLTGLLLSLRREPTATVPGVRVLDLLPAPYGDIARAVLLAVSGLLGSGVLALLVLLATTVPDQAALFDALAPGIVGGIVLTLVQLALLPLLALWALVVLLGGTVGVGTGTAISLDGAQTGVLPALPVLSALPAPGDFPSWTWALMIVPALPVALGAVRLVRDVSGLGLRDRITAWIAYPLVVIGAVLLLAGLSTGGIGDGRLVHLGPQMSTLAGPLAAIVALATALVLGVLATGLIPWTRRARAALRERIEAAERTERGETAAPGRTAPRGNADDPIPTAGAAGAAGADGADEVDEADRAEDPAAPQPEAASAPEAETEPGDDAEAGDDPEAESLEAESPAAVAEPSGAAAATRRSSWFSRRRGR
ncbi:DUF6350 family protein [Brachybacterium sp. UNK5269]|uniref:cell division protein PerM n=1 Tax=Brachybacterium sp. UNK5269 TaxID=3408576 RepID=UPI003BAF3388